MEDDAPKIRPRGRVHHGDPSDLNQYLVRWYRKLGITNTVPDHDHDSAKARRRRQIKRGSLKADSR